MNCFQYFPREGLFFSRKSKGTVSFLCNNKVLPDFYGSSSTNHLTDVQHESSRFHPKELHKQELPCSEIFPQTQGVHTFQFSSVLLPFTQLLRQKPLKLQKHHSIFFWVFCREACPSRLRTFFAFIQIVRVFFGFIQISYHVMSLTFTVKSKVFQLSVCKISHQKQSSCR